MYFVVSPTMRSARRLSVYSVVPLLGTNAQPLQFASHERRFPLQAFDRNSAMDEIVEVIRATLP